MADSVREARREAAFARLQSSFPLSISRADVDLPGEARLDDDEFVVRTSKDWGLSIKPLILTTRRLFCPADLTGRSSVALRLSDVRSVTLRKHWVGFSTIVVESRDRTQAAFAAPEYGGNPGLAGWKLVPPMLKRVQRTCNDEISLMLALTVCLVIAAITEAVGLSLALGAFLAGLLLGSSDFAHKLAKQTFSIRDAVINAPTKTRCSVITAKEAK